MDAHVRQVVMLASIHQTNEARSDKRVRAAQREREREREREKNSAQRGGRE